MTKIHRDMKKEERWRMRGSDRGRESIYGREFYR
jgi:hypothetical protein